MFQWILIAFGENCQQCLQLVHLQLACPDSYAWLIVEVQLKGCILQGDDFHKDRSKHGTSTCLLSLTHTSESKLSSVSSITFELLDPKIKREFKLKITSMMTEHSCRLIGLHTKMSAVEFPRAINPTCSLQICTTPTICAIEHDANISRPYWFVRTSSICSCIQHSFISNFIVLKFCIIKKCDCLYWTHGKHQHMTSAVIFICFHWMLPNSFTLVQYEKTLYHIFTRQSLFQKTKIDIWEIIRTALGFPPVAQVERGLVAPNH